MPNPSTNNSSGLPQHVAQTKTTTKETVTNCQMLGACVAFASMVAVFGTSLCLAFANKQETKETSAKIFIGLSVVAGVILIGMCVGKVGGCIKNEVGEEQRYLLDDVGAKRLLSDGVII